MFEIPLETLTFLAGENLLEKRYHAVKINNQGKVVIAGIGENAVGILQDTPEDGQAGRVMTLGITMVKSGGSITAGAGVAVGTGGVVVAAEGGDAVIGVALKTAVVDEILPVLLSIKTSTGTVLPAADSVVNPMMDVSFMKVATVDLDPAAAADDILFAWENTHAEDIIVHRVLVNVATAGGTATALIDVGAAEDAVIGSDNLIDGANLNVVALYDNIDNQGANGKSKQIVPAGEFVTGQAKVEKAEALVGKAYIFYTAI